MLLLLVRRYSAEEQKPETWETQEWGREGGRETGAGITELVAPQCSWLLCLKEAASEKLHLSLSGMKKKRMNLSTSFRLLFGNTLTTRGLFLCNYGLYSSGLWGKIDPSPSAPGDMPSTPGWLAAFVLQTLQYYFLIPYIFFSYKTSSFQIQISTFPDNPNFNDSSVTEFLSHQAPYYLVYISHSSL